MFFFVFVFVFGASLPKAQYKYQKMLTLQLVSDSTKNIIKQKDVSKGLEIIQ